MHKKKRFFKTSHFSKKKFAKIVIVKNWKSFVSKYFMKYNQSPFWRIIFVRKLKRYPKSFVRKLIWKNIVFSRADGISDFRKRNIKLFKLTSPESKNTVFFSSKKLISIVACENEKHNASKKSSSKKNDINIIISRFLRSRFCMVRQYQDLLQ